MNKSHHRTFTGDFKVFFLRGLAILLPSVLTIWIVVYAYQFVDTRIAEPINSITRLAVIKAIPLIYRTPGGLEGDALDQWARENHPDWYYVSPAEKQAEHDRRALEKLPRVSDATAVFDIRTRSFKAWWDQHRWLDAIGLILAILLFYLAGRIFGSFLGRRIAARLERLVASVPVFKQVYPYVKQLVDFMLGEKKIEFDRVVAVEYPRKGIWSIGFLTGHSINDVARVAGADPVRMVTVFIPSSPTPFTGYTITVFRDEIYPIGITVEEALRFVVSGGVLVPDRQSVPGTAGALEIAPLPSESGSASPALRSGSGPPPAARGS